MKIDILIVHFALIAAVFVPYIAFILIAAKQHKELKICFRKEADLNDIKPDRIDKWNLNIIGLDRRQQKILLFQQKKESYLAQILDLKTIRSSSVLHQVKHIRIGKKDEEVLQRVDLELTLNTGEKQLINLYDCDLTYVQDFELRNAEKWNRIIIDSVRYRPFMHTAA